MEADELLFELRGPSGEVWRLYLDGRAEGFPEGTVVANHALPLASRMLGEVNKQPVSLPAQ